MLAPGRQDKSSTMEEPGSIATENQLRGAKCKCSADCVVTDELQTEVEQLGNACHKSACLALSCDVLGTGNTSHLHDVGI